MKVKNWKSGVSVIIFFRNTVICLNVVVDGIVNLTNNDKSVIYCFSLVAAINRKQHLSASYKRRAHKTQKQKK